MIGVLHSSDPFSLSLIFRVINCSNDTKTLHGARRFHLGDFELVRKLAGGSYGETYEVVDSSRQSHVLKVTMMQIGINSEYDSCIREIVPFLAFPRHPCLIGLDGSIFDRNRGIISSIGLKELSIEFKLKIFYGLFSGVAFLHDHGFIHRYIHPSNVLASENY